MYISPVLIKWWLRRILWNAFDMEPLFWSMASELVRPCSKVVPCIFWSQLGSLLILVVLSLGQLCQAPHLIRSISSIIIQMFKASSLCSCVTDLVYIYICRLIPRCLLVLFFGSFDLFLKHVKNLSLFSRCSSNQVSRGSPATIC